MTSSQRQLQEMEEQEQRELEDLLARQEEEKQALLAQQQEEKARKRQEAKEVWRERELANITKGLDTLEEMR